MVTLSGSNVTQWTDKTGNGFHFTVPSGFISPVYTSNAINGLPALSFTTTGGDQMLRNTSISINVSAYTIFALVRQNASAPSPYGANYILGGNPTGGEYSLLYGTYTGGNFISSTGNSSNTWNDLAVNSPNTQLKSTTLTGMVVNGTVLTPYINGTAMNTKTGTTGPYTGMSVGGMQNGGQIWGGFICEILIFNSALTSSERQVVEGYLANKWGLTASLPNGHPFKTAKP
jgi:hypothetical protein